MAAGRIRSLLLEAFETVIEKVGHRIAHFDDEGATQAADLMASRQRKGRPVELRDTMIAGIVLARHATLSPPYVVHFEDLSRCQSSTLSLSDSLVASPACRAVQNR